MEFTIEYDELIPHVITIEADSYEEALNQIKNERGFDELESFIESASISNMDTDEGFEVKANVKQPSQIFQLLKKEVKGKSH